jgi:hypothetical protein
LRRSRKMTGVRKGSWPMMGRGDLLGFGGSMACSWISWIFVWLECIRYYMCFEQGVLMAGSI